MPLYLRTVRIGIWFIPLGPLLVYVTSYAERLDVVGVVEVVFEVELTPTERDLEFRVVGRFVWFRPYKADNAVRPGQC